MASKGREVANIVSAKTGIAVTISGDPIVVGVANTEILRITGSKGIGIGTVSNLSANFIKVSDRDIDLDDNKGLYFSRDDSASIRGSGGANGYLALAVNSEHIRLKRNGMIGINTVDPAAGIDIHGSGREVRFYRDARDRFGSVQYTGNNFQFKMPAGDHITFVDNSDIERFRFQNNGLIGIGTVSATHELEVHGDSANILIRDNSPYVDGTGGELRFEGKDSGDTFRHFASVMGVSNGSDAGDLVFTTRESSNTIEKARISKEGYLGIGTDDPLGMIHVQASDSTTYNATQDSASQQYGGATLSLRNVDPTENNYCSINFLTKQTASGGSRIVALNSGNNESTLTFCTESSGTPGERMRIANNGRVGIDNTSPTSTLHIGYDNNPLISIANGGATETAQSGIRWLFGSGNNEYAKIIGVSTESSSAELRFVTSNGGTQKAVTIDSVGRLGVGVTWPAHTIHAYEGMMIQYPGTPYIAFSEDSVERSLDSFVLAYDGTNYSNAGNHMFFASGAWTPHASGLNYKRMIITSKGEVGLNTVCGAGTGLGFEIDLYDQDNAGGHIAINRNAGGTYGDSDIGYITFYNAASQTGGKSQIGRIFCESETSGQSGSFEFYTRASNNSVMALRLANVGILRAPGVYTYTQGGSTVTVDSSGNLKRTSSSIKYKRDVEDLDYSIVDNAITNLQPRWYRTKDADGDDKLIWSHVGMIAEEVHLIEPRLVRYRTVGIGTTIKPAKYNDAGVELEPEKVKETFTELETPEPEDIDYGRLAVINLAEIKVLRARIAELESRVGIAST